MPLVNPGCEQPGLPFDSLQNINPYESPSIPPDDIIAAEAGPNRAEWPASGAFQFGPSLVWHYTTELPRICIYSGKPADGVITITTSSLIEDDHSIRPAIEKPRPLYRLVLPINQAATRYEMRRPWAKVFMWLSFVSLLLTTVFCSAASKADDGSIAGVFLAAFIGFATLASLLHKRHPQPYLLSIDNGYMQVFGLSVEFLHHLPEWPDRDVA